VENLYAIRSDGAGETIRLTEKDNPQYPQSFSPNGKYLVYFELNQISKRDFWILDLAERDPPKPGQARLLLGTPANEWYGRISPDGQWLAYSSDESGTYEVYVRRFSSTASATEVKWQISNGGGNHPEWSSNGRELFYGSDRGMMVTAYSTNGEVFVPGKPRIWVENKGLSHWYDLAPDGKRFALITGERPEKSRPARVVFLQNFFDELRRRAP
jgi:WD40 repeat protein